MGLRTLTSSHTFTLFILFVFITMFAAGCSPNDNELQPTAENGTIDLSMWNFEQNGPVQLSGEWEFYWKNLYEPDNFAEGNTPDGSLMRLPNTWNGHYINGDEVTATGFATYRLQLELGSSGQLLAIRLPYASTAYQAWVNGKEVAAAGKVGRDRESSEPQYVNKIIYIQGDAEIVIHVSNFEHRRGGLFQPLTIGTTDQIVRQTTVNTSIQLFLFGSLFIIGLYYTALFFYRIKALHNLFFGLICVMQAVHLLFVWEAVITQFFSDIPWGMMLTIEYLSLTFSKIVLFPLLINHIYQNIIPAKVMRTVWLVGSFFMMGILFSPPILFTQFLIVGQVVDIILMLYLWSVLLKAMLEKRESAKISFLCFSVYMLTAINDILHTRGVIDTGHFMYWGLYFFIFGQALILGLNFSKSFTAVEKLSMQLRKLSERLEEKVRQRTNKLEASNQLLRQTNEQLQEKSQKISEYEQSRRQLLTNISHELRTPMTFIQGYLEALIHNVIEDPHMRNQYLERIHGKAVGMNKLIEDLFELSRLEVKQSSFQMGFIETPHWLVHIYNKIQGDVQQANLYLHYEEHLLANISSTYVHIDSNRMEQVWTNLIYNAIKFSDNRSTISVQVDLTDGKKYDPDQTSTNSEIDSFAVAKRSRLRIKISDSGRGISDADLPYIFQRFYKAEGSAQQGSGLGLAIAKEIVDYHGGEIWAESRLNEGSHFYFTLPLYTKKGAQNG